MRRAVSDRRRCRPAAIAWKSRSTDSRPSLVKRRSRRTRPPRSTSRWCPSRLTEAVVVTARRVEEVAQEVPIPLSVVDGKLVADAGAFNVNRLKELIPTVQFYSTNPRNSAINIRGLGAPFGLTNDGLEPGVGLYIDGVFYARPASATLDFLDVERIEVLRGPQGTLFGKNTTAGAINVTTRKPSFTPCDRCRAELGDLRVRPGQSLGDRPARQESRGPRCRSPARSATAPSTTSKTAAAVNNLENLGLRGQLLFAPSDDARDHRDRSTTRVSAPRATRRSSPASRRRCVPRTGSTRRSRPISATRRQASTRSIASPTSTRRCARTRISAAPSLNVDWKVGRGRLTSTSAWRYWNWDPSNDRDFIGLPVTTISAAPSKQRQWTQEVRYAGDLSPRAELRRRRVRVPSGDRFRSRRSSRSRDRRRPGFCSRRPRPRRRRDCSMATASTSTSTYGNTSAALFGQVELVDDRPPSHAARDFDSTTTRRTSTSISRSTAACRRLIPR